MPIRLDLVPPPAPRPAAPRLWLWLGLLPLFMLLSAGSRLLFNEYPLGEQPVSFWGITVVVSLGAWCTLCFARVSIFVMQESVAYGWDEAREKKLISMIRSGRRSQQVLGASLYTALREPGAEPATQLDALLSGTRVFKAQSARLAGPIFRHSRLPGDATEDPERVLLRVLSQVLADLAPTLAQLPDARPLALLLEVDSQLAWNQVNRVWQQAWSRSGIRQSTVPVDGNGLGAVDHWLDQRINDQALLMVVAVRLAPLQPKDTAEAAVGLLFGNRLTQATLTTVACLHRPEQEREPSTEKLGYAVRQALDWVPLEAPSIEQVWRVGIDAKREMALSAVLSDMAMPVKHDQTLCNLDALLGHPGKASPWLAIAAATQAVQKGCGPQFIFSGDSSVDAGLWGAVLMPVK